MTALAILAKAPIPGYAKTRLAARLGAEGAAALQARLVRRAVAVGLSSGLAPIALWGAPDAGHPLFRELGTFSDLRLLPQPEGDLGARMAAAFAATNGPLVLIGTDCPPLDAGHLRWAADAIGGPADVAIVPAEDGGYVLIAARECHAVLFDDMPWGGHDVAALTRSRASAAGLRVEEHSQLWDVDRPEDLDRLAAWAPHGTVLP